MPENTRIAAVSPILRLEDGRILVVRTILRPVEERISAASSIRRRERSRIGGETAIRRPLDGWIRADPTILWRLSPAWPEMRSRYRPNPGPLRFTLNPRTESPYG